MLRGISPLAKWVLGIGYWGHLAPGEMGIRYWVLGTEPELASSAAIPKTWRDDDPAC
jgi:hypothetical protein